MCGAARGAETAMAQPPAADNFDERQRYPDKRKDTNASDNLMEEKFDFYGRPIERAEDLKEAVATKAPAATAAEPESVEIVHRSGPGKYALIFTRTSTMKQEEEDLTKVPLKFKIQHDHPQTRAFRECVEKELCDFDPIQAHFQMIEIQAKTSGPYRAPDPETAHFDEIVAASRKRKCV